MKSGQIRFEYRRSLTRSLVLALAAPGLVTLTALGGRHVDVAIAALLYVLAVVVSSALGGAGAGLGASLTSFVALNFFFTPPLHTLVIATSEDVVALLVFLVTSSVIGLLVSTAVDQRARVETREREARLLNRLNSQLLAGEAVQTVLERFAQGLVGMLGLHACRIAAAEFGPDVVVEDGNSVPLTTGQRELPLETRGERVGMITITPSEGNGPLSHRDLDVLDAASQQLVLALEGMRLSRETHQSKLDAETSRLRSVLFSSVTHDLKTPLSSITAAVTSLIDGRRFTAEERDDHLETIKQEAERLNRLVTNLLDLSRLRAGALIPSKELGSIEEVVEAVLARTRPRLAGRQLEVRLPPDLPEIQMDLIQIDQVLTNLIENADKFSPPGTPISISAVGWSGGVRVTIADRGPGIPKDQRERAFEPFEQVNGGEGSGTGLGLAIARAAVIAHGGRIWLQGTPGGGTTVVFELPADRDPGEVNGG